MPAAKRSAGVLGLDNFSCDRHPRYGCLWLNEDRADPHGDVLAELAPLFSLLVLHLENEYCDGPGLVTVPMFSTNRFECEGEQKKYISRKLTVCALGPEFLTP